MSGAWTSSWQIRALKLLAYLMAVIVIRGIVSPFQSLAPLVGTLCFATGVAFGVS